MKIDLPSGGWVEYRDKLMASDKFAVQESITLTFTDGNAQLIHGGIQNQMRNALLARIITAWSFEAPIPSQDIRGADAIGEAMDLDDYNKLQEDVEPLLAKVAFAPNPQRSSG